MTDEPRSGCVRAFSWRLNPDGELDITTKKQVEEIIASLSRAHALKREIDERAREVVKRCVIAESPRDFSLRHCDQTHFDWTIDSDGGVEGSWEYRWEKGGIAGGHVNIPIEYLWNEAALAAFEEQCTLEKEERKRQADEEQRQRDLAQLKKLKEKLGPEVDNFVEEAQ